MQPKQSKTSDNTKYIIFFINGLLDCFINHFGKRKGNLKWEITENVFNWTEGDAIFIRKTSLYGRSGDYKQKISDECGSYNVSSSRYTVLKWKDCHILSNISDDVWRRLMKFRLVIYLIRDNNSLN